MKKKLVIAVASHDTVHATFASDAMALCLLVGASLGDEWQAAVRGVLGTYIHLARESLLKNCIEDGADYMLWLDADMRFPADGLAALMAHGKPVVGVNYATRRLPTRFVALAHTSGEHGGTHRLETRPDSTGLVQVDALGFGFLLMDLNAIKHALPTDKPWFSFNFNGQDVGEDVYFCRLMEQAGIPIYVDHDLSKRCAHSGQIDFLTNHALLFKDGKPVPPSPELLEMAAV